MYDALRNRFRLACPTHGVDVERPLSAFRTLDRLPGTAHPVAYRVTYACSACPLEHVALVSQYELDCAAIAPDDDQTFLNVVTGRHERVSRELADVAQGELRRGNWPWTFFCTDEHDIRPGYPSQLLMLAPTGDGALVGAAVTCSVCAKVSVNLVSPRHLDQPFFHDPVVRYLEGGLPEAADALTRFRHELWSGRFDEERNWYAP